MNADAFHRVIADALDDSMLAKARARLDRWSRTAPGTHVQRWRPLLDLPVAQVRDMLISLDPDAVELRAQVPFLSVLDVSTRRRVVDIFAGSGGVR
ncbi:hypothetical protein [Dolichospermum phage Dfl-JY14]